MNQAELVLAYRNRVNLILEICMPPRNQANENEFSEQLIQSPLIYIKDLIKILKAYKFFGDPDKHVTMFYSCYTYNWSPYLLEAINTPLGEFQTERPYTVASHIDDLSHSHLISLFLKK